MKVNSCVVDLRHAGMIMKDADLFERYLEVCNRALAHNHDKFPFAQMLAALQAKQIAKNIDVNIINDCPNPLFVIRLENNKIYAKQHDSKDMCPLGATWNVSKSYLKDVVAHADEYIKNPALIDWEWVHLDAL